ncbi:MAG: ABC transporter substrate-binding protein [Oscillospiraceae bacterium]|nr:ABC transporter substrate-binding protein [Oscillospiraceae bacterium]
MALLLAAAVMCALITGCKDSNVRGKELVKLTVSEVTHSIFYAPMYVSINNGYFEEMGIDVELINAGGADKVMTALLTGGADIGFAGPEAVIYVCAQGKEDYPRVFAQLTRCDGSFLVGREDVENFDWQDLRGSTILPGRKGGIPYMTLLYCLNQNGMEVGKDVFFDDSIRFNAMTGAFVSGTGDYVTVFEPGATDLENQGKGYILASIGEEGGRVPYTTYFANAPFLENNRELVQRFTDAIYMGQQFVTENSAEVVAQAIAPSFPDTDMATITAVVQRYKNIGAYSDNGTMSEEDFDRLCEILANAGELSRPVKFEDIVDNSFAQAAVE